MTDRPKRIPERVLDILKKKYSGDFFSSSGENVERHPEIVRRIVREDIPSGFTVTSMTTRPCTQSTEKYVEDF